MPSAPRSPASSDGATGPSPVEGIRFEVPSAYRTLLQLRVRVARWDKSSVDLVDPRSGKHLAAIWPLDRTKNAERVRRVVAGVHDGPTPEPSGIAPHLLGWLGYFGVCTAGQETGLPSLDAHLRRRLRPVLLEQWKVIGAPTRSAAGRAGDAKGVEGDAGEVSMWETGVVARRV